MTNDQVAERYNVLNFTGPGRTIGLSGVEYAATSIAAVDELDLEDRFRFVAPDSLTEAETLALRRWRERRRSREESARNRDRRPRQRDWLRGR